MLETTVPKSQRHIYVVVDHFKIHHAKAVTAWLADHPRVTLLFLPSSCPQANPIERVFGDVHDKCTRNHKRTQLAEVVADVKEHFQVNGPWLYQLSEIYYTPEVTAEVERLAQLDEDLAAA
ncbi:MAG: transposase [Blastocatellia bacterium]|nr:transposase [Blastocatellia bacterium]